MFCSEDKLKQSKRTKVRRVFSFVEDLISFWYFSLWNEAPKFCLLERDVTLFLCTNYRQLVINWLLLVINWLFFKPNCTDQKGVLNSKNENFSLPAAVYVSKRWLLELSFISCRPLADLSPACVAPGPILLARPKQKCTLIGQWWAPVRRQEYPWSRILLLELLGTDKSRLKWRVFSLLVRYNLAWKWILNFCSSRITTNQEFNPSEEYDVLIRPWMEAWYFKEK